jgi:uncharacterized membrane protein (UPF0127 family)
MAAVLRPPCRPRASVPDQVSTHRASTDPRRLATSRRRAPSRRRSPARRLLVAVVVASLVAACGDDAGTSPGATAPTLDGPSPEISLADLATAAGDSPAATGADVDEPPGPAGRAGLPGTSETAASVTAADGTVAACCLLVAADSETRRRGLMEVTDLGGYQGMVFVWADETSSGFWMRNTPTPLSIAFFDAEGAFVGSSDMEPCEDSSDCPVHPSPGTYRFALEVFRGELDALGVGPGSTLALGGPCAAAS